MPERQQLDLQVGTTTNGVTGGSEKSEEDGIHRPTLAQSRVTAKRSEIQRRTEFSEGTVLSPFPAARAAPPKSLRGAAATGNDCHARRGVFSRGVCIDCSSSHWVDWSGRSLGGPTGASDQNGHLEYYRICESASISSARATAAAPAGRETSGRFAPPPPLSASAVESLAATTQSPLVGSGLRPSVRYEGFWESVRRHDLYALAPADAALALAAVAGLASGAGVSLTFFTFGWRASSAWICTRF